MLINMRDSRNPFWGFVIVNHTAYLNVRVIRHHERMSFSSTHAETHAIREFHNDIINHVWSTIRETCFSYFKLLLSLGRLGPTMEHSWEQSREDGTVIMAKMEAKNVIKVVALIVVSDILKNAANVSHLDSKPQVFLSFMYYHLSRGR